MTPLVTTSHQSPSSTSPHHIASLVSTLAGAPPLVPSQLAAMYSSATLSDPTTTYSLPPLVGDQSAFYAPQMAALDIKDSLAASPMPPGWPYASMYYAYDPALASYPLAGYGMGLDAARRKNATREATATLKAWLNEHKKNPYPTKGEKIMLAIITKMTLTQVSTWFANARRRLKKENKMTWEPRSKTDEDDDDDDDDIDEDKLDDKSYNGEEEKKGDSESMFSKDRSECVSRLAAASDALSGRVPPSTDVHPKPRIWSLADMATSGSLSSTTAVGNLTGSVGGKIMTGGLTRGLHHLEGTPYSRPLFGHSPYPYIPGSVSESLLSYSYGKSFGSFPPLSLGDVAPGLLASPFVHELVRPEIIRPEPRPLPEKEV